MCIQVRPGYSLAYNDLGVVLQTKGDIARAAECYKKAVELNANFSEAQNNLGTVAQGRGDHSTAREYFKRAKEINPYYFDACNNYIFALDLSEDVGISELVEERRKWAELHEAPLLHKQRPHSNKLTTDRKLRIGYVSADMRLHSASFVFGSVLDHFDREKFEVYAYNNANNPPDSRTESFKEKVTVWREIAKLKDDELVELVRSDEIDILVDLSGYSAGSRLLAFAQKPAPVQVTAWGYATSTGMKSIDYFFADACSGTR